ncbi:hypothetical protein [Paenibacillus sp. GCM10027626]|uniref:hypothetical protein n=1 Tax=Paenibacillus sp. GCM10027626 TaxID=3273411 RepID=UPI00362CC0AF
MSMPNDNELQLLEDELRQPLSKLLTGTVTSQDTARLLRILQPEFEQLKQICEDERYGQRAAGTPRRPTLLRLIRSQLSSYSKAYWIASLFVFVMLLIVLPTHDGVTAHSVGALFTFVLPALLLASLAYSFRSWNKEMRMIETITPYPPALLLIVRTMIVISLNLLYGIAGSIYMTVQVASFPVLPFMLEWMSLLLLVSGIAAYALMWKGFKTAIAFAGAFWISWNGFTQRIITIDNFAYDQNTFILQIASVVAGLLLLAMAYKRSYGTKLLP